MARTEGVPRRLRRAAGPIAAGLAALSVAGCLSGVTTDSAIRFDNGSTQVLPCHPDPRDLLSRSNVSLDVGNPLVRKIVVRDATREVKRWIAFSDDLIAGKGATVRSGNRQLGNLFITSEANDSGKITQAHVAAHFGESGVASVVDVSPPDNVDPGFLFCYTGPQENPKYYTTKFNEATVWANHHKDGLVTTRSSVSGPTRDQQLVTLLAERPVTQTDLDGIKRRTPASGTIRWGVEGRTRDGASRQGTVWEHHGAGRISNPQRSL
jgi:hypothetical protein